jgi:3-deoxy-D-manno-octulosonic-acid transferase
MRFVYTGLLTLALPLLLARLWWRGRREPGYRRNIGERLGRYALPRAEKMVWVHAVSVGEARAAAPLVRRLQQALPDHGVLMTCTTAATANRCWRAFCRTTSPAPCRASSSTSGRAWG